MSRTHSQRIQRRLLSLAMTGAFALLLSSTASAVTLYSVAALDTLGGSSLARGLNDHGEAVGISIGAGDRGFRAVRWDANGTIHDLGTGANSDALGINNSGQIVGHFRSANSLEEAFLWENNNASGLGMLGGGTTSSAFAINEAGRIVGYSDGAFGNPHAVEFGAGGPSALGSIAIAEPLGGADSAAYAVNNTGEIAGMARLGGGRSFCDFTSDCRAFVHEGGAMQNLDNQGGSLAFGQQVALGMNDEGEVVGWAEDANGNRRAFLFDSNAGSVLDLGTLEGADESTAWDVNDAGQVVGWYETGIGRAFVYQDGEMHELNSLVDPNDALFGTINFAEARAINEAGQIIVNGIGAGGTRSWLLTPVDEPGGAVPEPTAALLFAAGMGALGLRGLRDPERN